MSDGYVAEVYASIALRLTGKMYPGMERGALHCIALHGTVSYHALSPAVARYGIGIYFIHSSVYATYT